MTHNLKNLFGIGKSDSNVSDQDINIIQPSASLPSQGSYKDYGIRECGKSNGSPLCLTPYLHKIFTNERQKQANNSQLQDIEKQKKQKEINDLDLSIAKKNTDMDLIKNKIEQCNDQIKEYEVEVQELKTSIGTVNKNAQLKMCIGTLILVILTLYLFIFYSSTFYSAFFKDFLSSETINIGDAIFDAQAIPKSLAAGTGQMLFVISAPIIFLGLGFSLHYFSQEEGKGKYLKISAIIIVTFIFDCILAYGIAKKMYDIMALSTLENMPPYSLKDAYSDSHVWTVIFCGFVVYIIWGIVFSMTMNAFENLRSNKSAIAVLKSKIQHEKDRCAILDGDRIKLEGELKSLINERNIKQKQLDDGVIIKYSDIKVALSDFFAGWNSLLIPLGKTPEEIQETKLAYESTVEVLIPQLNTKISTL